MPKTSVVNHLSELHFWNIILTKSSKIKYLIFFQMKGEGVESKWGKWQVPCQWIVSKFDKLNINGTFTRYEHLRRLMKDFKLQDILSD